MTQPTSPQPSGSRPEDMCPRCEGSGKFGAYLAGIGGSPQFTCSLCNGTRRKLPAEDSQKLAGDECYHCRGTGLVIAREGGRVPCSICSGTGKSQKGGEPCATTSKTSSDAPVTQCHPDRATQIALPTVASKASSETSDPLAAGATQAETPHWTVSCEDGRNDYHLLKDESGNLIAHGENRYRFLMEVAAAHNVALASAQQQRDAAQEKLRKAMATLKRIGCNQSRYYGSEAMNMYNELNK